MALPNKAPPPKSGYKTKTAANNTNSVIPAMSQILCLSGAEEKRGEDKGDNFFSGAELGRL